MSRRLPALLLLALAAACAREPRVPRLRLRYDPLPPAPKEAFRSEPPPATPVPAAAPLAFQVRTLPNGLTVALLERHDLPVVSVSLVVARGSADVRAPAEALELLENVLDACTAARTEPEIAAAWADLGARHRTSVGKDAVTLDARGGAADLDTTVALLTEAATRPEPAYLPIARGLWEQRLSGRRDHAEGVGRNLRRILLGDRDLGWAYGRAVPSKDRAARLVPSDLAHLHAKLFHPAHTTLLVVGDASPEAVYAAAARRLGGWEGSAPPSPRSPVEIAPPGHPSVVFIEEEWAGDVYASIGALGPAADDADLPALEVTAQALGGLSAPLREEVSEEKGAAYDIIARVISARRVSVLEVGGAFDEQKAVAALRSMLGAIDALRTRGPSQAELERARENVLSAWRTDVSSVSGLAALATSAIERDLPLDVLATYPGRVRAVTREDVQRVAQRYLGQDQLRVAVLGKHQLRKELEALGLGQAEYRDWWGSRAFRREEHAP